LSQSRQEGAPDRAAVARHIDHVATLPQRYETVTIQNPHQAAARLGLPPLQKSGRGKEHPGEICKLGDKYLRRLLVTGATELVRQFRSRPDKTALHFALLLARQPVRAETVALVHAQF
jgi:transposase